MSTGESTKVFRGLSQQTIITLIYAIIQLAYFSIMSRLLSKEDFGFYAILSAVTYVLMEISQAGLGSAVIQKKYISDSFVKTAFTLSVIIGGAFMLLLIAISGFISEIQTDSDYLRLPLCIMAIALFFSTVSGVSIALFMRDLQFLEYGIIQITASLISSAVGVLMAYKGCGVYALVVAIFLNFFLLAIFTIIKKRSFLGIEIKKGEVKNILTYGGWLTASGVVRSLYEQMDRLITARWISVALLGTYTRIAGFVINISSNVNSIFDTILFPIISGIQDDRDKLQNAYIKSTELIFLMSFVFSFSMILMAEPIICIFLGKKWLDSTFIFNIVAISLLFHPYGRLGDSFFRSLGIVKQYFYVRVFICISSVLLICIGCVTMGINGLAYAYVCSRILDALVKMILLNRNIEVGFASVVKNPVHNALLIGVCFILTYAIKYIYEPIIGSIIACSIFILLLLLIALLKPRIFGETLYNYIYLNLKQKFNCSHE
jgi:PST family polysaccharide transporter